MEIKQSTVRSVLKDRAMLSLRMMRIMRKDSTTPSFVIFDVDNLDSSFVPQQSAWQIISLGTTKDDSDHIFSWILQTRLFDSFRLMS